MKEILIYIMTFTGVSITLYFWYKEVTIDYLADTPKRSTDKKHTL